MELRPGNISYGMLFSRSVSTQEGIAWIFFSESMKLPL
jgi:hypothetical protein